MRFIIDGVDVHDTTALFVVDNVDDHDEHVTCARVCPPACVCAVVYVLLLLQKVIIRSCV